MESIINTVILELILKKSCKIGLEVSRTRKNQIRAGRIKNNLPTVVGAATQAAAAKSALAMAMAANAEEPDFMATVDMMNHEVVKNYILKNGINA